MTTCATCNHQVILYIPAHPPSALRCSLAMDSCVIYTEGMSYAKLPLNIILLFSMQLFVQGPYYNKQYQIHYT